MTRGQKQEGKGAVRTRAGPKSRKKASWITARVGLKGEDKTI